jgi:hypothetical protein
VSQDQSNEIFAELQGDTPSTIEADTRSVSFMNIEDMEVDVKPISKPIDFGIVSTGARELAEQRRKAREERRRQEAHGKME